MNQIKYGVILSYVSLAVNNVVTILYTPVLLRMLGQSEYGLYSLVASVIAYLTVLDLGLGNTIVRYSALYKSIGNYNQLYSLFGLFVRIYTGIGLIALLAGTVVYLNLGNILDNSMSLEEISRAKIMFLLLILNLSVSFPLSIFGSIVTAYQRFIFSRAVNILRIILQPIIMLPLLFWGYKAITLVVVISLLNLGTLLANMFYAFVKLKIKVHYEHIDIKLIKEIAIFSFFIFLGVAVDRLNWSTGQLVLGIYSGAAEVAVYAVAIQIVLCYFGFASSISGVFFPKITEIITQQSYEKKLSDLFIKVGRLQYIILLLVLSGFFFFGQHFIYYWAGNDYTEAYSLSLILMVPITFTSIQHIGVLILQALNKQRFRSIVLFVISVTNIILSCLLVKQFEALGCAISLATCIVFGNVIIMNFYFYKKMHVDIPAFWREILYTIPFVICMIVVGTGITYLSPIDSVSKLLMDIFLYVFLYFVVGYRFLLNEYEKKLIISFVKKIANGRNSNKKRWV